MEVGSVSELKTAIMRDIRKAMNVASSKALADLYEGTGDFYTGDEPNRYERTGALGDTPRVTGLTSGSDEVSFRAYLDTAHQYSTGIQPSMSAVLELANEGSYPGMRPTVGKNGFFDRADDNIEKDIDSVFNSFFG